MTLDEVRILLKYQDEPNKKCGNVNDLLDEHIRTVETRMNELAQLKQHLIVLRQKCMSEATAESCGILNTLADSSCHK